MEKITTIFDRDWEGTRGVVPKLLVNPGGAIATEKLDGTNVRLTVRKGLLVRVEARMNPPKLLKQSHGIENPWYRDAMVINSSYGLDPGDKYIVEAAQSTPLWDVPDGEWSAEAVGPKIQGNPLALEEHGCYFFDRSRLPLETCVPVLDGAPVISQDLLETHDDAVERYFNALRDYLNSARSRINPDVGIEGIVWSDSSGYSGKIKLKDFK